MELKYNLGGDFCFIFLFADIPGYPIFALPNKTKGICQDGPVAQLNRVTDYGSVGFRFES